MRKSNNLKYILTIDGITKSVLEWSKDPKCEIGYDQLLKRVKENFNDGYILARLKEKRLTPEKQKLKEELYNLYVIQNKKVVDIAKIYQKETYEISNKLRDFKIRKGPKRVYFVPEIGQKFNMLTFLKVMPFKNKQKQIVWEMQCDCGKITQIGSLRAISGRTKSCRCLQTKTTQKNKYTGYNDISGTLWNSIVKNAEKRNLEFDISIDYIWNLFIKQEKKCALSGESLNIARITQEKTTASLDRIDSSKGYIKGNVQWTTKKINMAKQALLNEEFIDLCSRVVEFNKCR